MSNSQSIYAYRRDRSKYRLNDHLDDIESNKNSITGIMNDLDDIDGRLDGIDQSINGINNNISSMGDTISVITSSLGAAKTDISTLEDDVSTLSNRVTPIAKGGTGSTTARAARHALGLNFDSGDVISGTFYGAGYVTCSGKYFVFEIPLSKVVDGSLSLVSIGVTIRQGGNYIFGSASSGSEQDVKSITTLTKMNGGIRIELRPSSMPANTINNDVFGVACTIRINIT